MKRLYIKPNTKELAKLLTRNLIAFGVIFILLGVIILYIANVTVYQQVDEVIEQTMSDSNMLGYKASEPIPDKALSTQYSLQVILWSKDGQPINAGSHTKAYIQDNHLKLNTKHINEIYSCETTNKYGAKVYYRSLVKRALKNDHRVAFVEVDVVTNQIHAAMKSMKKMIFFCILVFWIISLGVSYFLAKRSMRPILSSWEKQKMFVEDASHELKTPLAVIQAKLEQLLTTPTHTILDEAENISVSLNEVRRLNRLTKDLVSLTRSDNNDRSVNLQNIDISTFIYDIFNSYEELAAMHERHLYLEDNTNHQKVSVDPELIRQLLVILIDNAIKYTNKGGNIWLSSRIHNNQWICEVRDDGIGVSDKDKKHLFERFYRVDSSRTRETGGTGLGLSIAQWIIQIHHGSIKVLDNHPKGLIMKITFPLK